MNLSNILLKSLLKNCLQNKQHLRELKNVHKVDSNAENYVGDSNVNAHDKDIKNVISCQNQDFSNFTYWFHNS